jgi:hypothetical protein
MAERRPLIAGLKPSEDVDPAKEKEFVFGPKADPGKEAKSQHTQAATAEAREAKGTNPIGRVPLTIRVRADYGKVLKRASLERQIEGVFPNTLQDIIEEAVEPWLRQHGYIP